MSGSITEISMNGIKFNVPSDTEVSFTKGGKVATESTTYGNGSTRGHFRPIPGRIAGVIVDIEDDSKFDSLLELAALESLDVVLTDSNGAAYGGAGQIIASSEDGIQRNSMNGNTSEEFEIKARNGKFEQL